MCYVYVVDYPIQDVIMTPFFEQAHLYAAYHQRPLTRYVQMIETPLLILSLMIFLGCIHVIIPGILDVNLAAIGGILLLVYYFRLNWRLALVITPLFVLLWWVGSLFSHPTPSFFTLSSFIITLVLCILLRVAAYFVEGKHPAFMEGLKQTRIGPLMMAIDIISMVGLMHGLKEEIYGKENAHARL
jgi:uncharacterized membrane protein YGL010W